MKLDGVRAFIFDLDGTLVDLDLSFAEYFLDRYPDAVHSDDWLAFWDRYDELSQAHRGDKAHVFATLRDEYDLPDTPQRMLKDYRSGIWFFCKLFYKTEDALKDLRARGFKLGIVTNGTTECQSQKISGTRLDEFTDCFLISETEGVRKPDAEIFLRAASRLEVKPEECCVVGDNAKDDIGGALAAGMRAIWIGESGEWPEGLPFAPEKVLKSVAEVPSLLGSRVTPPR